MQTLLRRLRYLLRGRFDADLAEEMAFHRDMTRRELEARGESPDDARIGADRRFGSGALAHDRSRDVWVPVVLQDISRDARFAARLLWKDRGFALAATMTLALGIGVAGTLFTIFDGMFLKGLPVDRPDRIVTVRAFDRHSRPLQLSPAEFDDWRGANRYFSSLASYTGAIIVLGDEGAAPERVPGSFLSSAAFALLEVPPLLGRGFTEAEDRPGAPRVVVLGEAIWRERYGSDPHIVGRSIRVNGESTTVVGVMPARYRFPVIDNAWLPLGMAPAMRDDKRDARALEVVGRLADGATMTQARGELDAVEARRALEFPDTDAGVRTRVEAYTHGFSGFDNPWSDSLLAAGFLLLIGCANVAALLLARGAGRARDLAIRTALGASRWRLLRQLLVESAILSALAACVGLGLTWSGVKVWIASLPVTNWPYWFRWDIDSRVLAFLTIAAAGTALAAGMAPALHLSSVGAQASMKDDVRSGTTSRRARRLTAALVGAELAFTLVLLAGTGLMVRTTIKLLQVDSVVDSAHVLMANLNLTQARYATPESRVRFVETLADRLEAVPAIRSAAAANAMPFLTAPLRALAIAGRDEMTGGPRMAVSYVTIGDEYFDAIGVHLLLGRRFGAADGTSGHAATIVNQQFVQMYFGGRNPLGAAIRLTDPNDPAVPPWLTIVGVSPTVRQHYGQDLDPVAYVPYRQDPTAVPLLLMRIAGNPNAAIPAMRGVVRDLDSNVVAFNVMSLEDLMNGSGFANRVFMTFFAVFGSLALLLSAIGLYAATSRAVIERQHEIGVRMALGAQGPQIVWLFARRALVVLAFGAAAGLAAAFAVTRLMRGFLVQTSPFDPATMAATTALLVIVALAATIAPAYRAAGRDPLLTLRCD